MRRFMRELTAGVIITLIAGLILAFVLREGPFAAPASTPTSAVARFIGNWTSEETPEREAINRAEIRSDGSTIFVHLWSECTPTVCDWGEQTTDVADANDGTLALTWLRGSETHTQELSVLSDGRLRIVGTATGPGQTQNYTYYLVS